MTRRTIERVRFIHRHEIDDRYLAAFIVELGFQNQSAILIVPAHFGGVARPDFPAAVFALAQKSRETGGRIEPWRTEPVDRSVTPDKRGRAHIADHRVIFNPAGHYARLSCRPPAVAW